MTRSPSILADCIGQLAWLAQSTHQAHHQDSDATWRDCPRGTCQSAASFCGRLERALREELEPVQSTSHATVEQLVTATKQHGCALELCGNTTPEGWPYRAILVIEKPGQPESLARRLDELEAELARLASFVERVDAP